MASINQWLQDLRRPRLEITAPSFTWNAEATACFTLVKEGKKNVWTITATDVGFVARWNAGHPGERLKKGDRLVEVNGCRVSCEASLLLACQVAGPPTLLFTRACPNVNVAERVQ